MAALEVWVDSPSTISDVQFDHNTCFNAGFGWAQRPTLGTSGLVVRTQGNDHQ